MASAAAAVSLLDFSDDELTDSTRKTSTLALINSSSSEVQAEDEESDTESESSDDGVALEASDDKLRLQQKAIFNDFLTRHEEPLLRKSTEVEEDVPVTSQQERSQIIDKVRSYQQELFEKAKEENIIAVLDTGSGKTLIACLLIRHVLEQERIRHSGGERERWIFFLANSVHLVQQQGKVLTNNLIEKPKILYGGINLDLSNGDTWSQIREQSKVVVCTPEILNQCLMRGHISMAEIVLLVFDEAHHTKKDHPYSRLIRSYYLKCSEKERPRIFGMTASPIDDKGDIEVRAETLEKLLHSKIVTTNDMSILPFAPKPRDEKWFYTKLRPRFQTELCSRLRSVANNIEDLKKGFDFSAKAVSELGPWCADRVWYFIFEGSANIISKKYENSRTYQNLRSVEERQQALRSIDQAAALVNTRGLDWPTLTSQDLSSKVIDLHNRLTLTYTANPETRAIVFVTERLKALVLRDLFQKLHVPNLRPEILLGITGGGASGTSLRSQEQVLEHFRAGLVNLVFATSVADEGLDIPQCNLCIRFDLCTTTIQYMQSRGRARMENSIFAHMVEADNFEHNRDVDFQIDQERYIKAWCAKLSPDRRLKGTTQLTRLLKKDASSKSFKTESGAICDYSNCLLILARFAASLAHTGATESEVYEEEIDAEKNLFRYTVRLPTNTESKVKGCRGDWQPNKQLAKRSAAWNCCFILRGAQELTGNLDPIYKKFKPSNANALLAVTGKKSAYDKQVKPAIWAEGLGSLPKELYGTVLHFEAKAELRRPLAPIVLLARTRLPSLPRFKAYVNDVEVDIVPREIQQSFAVGECDVALLTVFTLEGVFADVFNKVYQHESKSMSYWLCPLSKAFVDGMSNFSDLVENEVLRRPQQERLSWQVGMCHQDWTRKFLCDPLNGKFHYFTGDIIPGAGIYDKVKLSPDRKITQKRRTTIIDFSDSHWTASRKKAVAEEIYDKAQPVLEADLVGTKRNFLDSATGSDMISCQIAPQTLQVARIDADFAASCLLWPAIIHRIEAYLIALEGFAKLGLQAVPAALALEAFTKDADDENEAVETHTGGKRGMGKNYERLEFIGDSLLKMTTTITVFNLTKCDEEGMHCRRMEILCNRRLYDVSTGPLKLYQHAQADPFDRVTWYPEHLTLLRGRGAQKEPKPSRHTERTQSLGMKTIADISEAIIGAAVITSQLEHKNFDMGIRAITKLVESEDHQVSSWSDFANMYKAPVWSLQLDDVRANEMAIEIEARTGYKFKHPRLLRSAFTHSSEMNSPVPDLQRMEFLGDAVLDWVCISWLFNTNPTKNPQWLTEHKMAMVSNKFLAALAVTLDFDKLIIASHPQLYGDIMSYAQKVRIAMEVPDFSLNFWTEIQSPPKSLSDLVESYLGAILIDSGFEYSVIEDFFERFVKKFFVNIEDYDTFANRQPTTYLYKKLGSEFKCRDYSILDSEPKEGMIETVITAGVIIHNRVVASSTGTSAKYARVRASKKVNDMMEGLSREEFRAQFGCTCRVKEE